MSYLKIYFTFVLCLNIMQKAQGEEKKEEKQSRWEEETENNRFRDSESREQVNR